LGSFLAQAEGLKQLHVTFQEEQPQSVGLVFRGPFQDHTLRRFKISGDDDDTRLSLDDWSCISQYLGKAPSLRHLDLNDLSLSRGDLELLASALERAKLKTLGFTGLHMRDDEDDSLGILFSSMNVTKLETVDIVGCGAGVSTCEGLANILRNKESKLEILNIDSNAIDNSCVKVLCQSLAENTSLKVLHIHDNEDITDEGWALFEKLVFDASNLEGIYSSNHTLGNIAGHPRPQLFHANYYRGPSKRGHAKILFLINPSFDFNIEPLVDFDIKMMPYVLEFFGNRVHVNLDNETDSPCSWLYQIIRRWNMPELFSFPSAEKVRLTAKVDELEREMELLRLENLRLTSENNLLKSEVQSSGERNPNNAKRTRTIS